MLWPEPTTAHNTEEENKDEVSDEMETDVEKAQALSRCGRCLVCHLTGFILLLPR